MSVRFYTSDSPCRRCNGTERYRNTSLRGQCTGCARADDSERRARVFVAKIQPDALYDADGVEKGCDEADLPLIFEPRGS